MTTERLKISYEEYLTLPDNGKQYQLLDGELIVTPSPNTRHQWILNMLRQALTGHVLSHALGKVFPAPIDEVLSELNVLQPDILFVSCEREAIITEAHIAGAPDLVVEILSPSTSKRDRGIKKSLGLPLSGSVR